MIRTIDLRDCSRQFLEACADSVQRQVDAGEHHLQGWLDQVRAAIPDAPPYSIVHRRD